MISKTHTKYIQSLQHKKFRDESALFVAEGPKVVVELLMDKKFVCKEIFALGKWIKENEKSTPGFSKTTIFEVKDFELEKISSLAVPNQVLAVFEKRKSVAPIEYNGKISLVLDSIQDPGNLGTIIRIADWFGVETIICSQGCADMYNPKVVQSTMGSLGRVNIFYDDLPGWLQKNDSIKKYAAGLEGKAVGNLTGIKEGIFIIGNESKGISDEVIQYADERITIPKTGKAESLNAAVATGIILSHLTGY